MNIIQEFSPPRPSTGTYRNIFLARFIETIAEAIGGSPWADEVEVAIRAIMIRFNTAIDGNPIVAELLDAPIREPYSGPLTDDGEIPF